MPTRLTLMAKTNDKERMKLNQSVRKMPPRRRLDFSETSFSGPGTMTRQYMSEHFKKMEEIYAKKGYASNYKPIDETTENLPYKTETKKVKKLIP